MIRKTSRWIVYSLSAAGLVLAISCAAIVIRGRRTLDTLLHPGDIPVMTEVYSRWVTLQPGAPITWDGVLATLQALDYQSVTGKPAQPGQYSRSGDTLTLFTRETGPDESAVGQPGVDGVAP